MLCLLHDTWNGIRGHLEFDFLSLIVPKDWFSRAFAMYVFKITGTCFADIFGQAQLNRMNYFSLIKSGPDVFCSLKSC